MEKGSLQISKLSYIVVDIVRIDDDNNLHTSPHSLKKKSHKGQWGF